MELEDTFPLRTQRPARAVFSNEDFRLLRDAILTHLKAHQDSPESIKYSNLYHRLGRLD